MCILCDSTCEDRACTIEEPASGEASSVPCGAPVRRPSMGKNKNSMRHVMYRSPECRAQNLAPMGSWQSCTSWRDAWPSLSLGARTQVELLDAILGAQNSRRATSRSDIWTRVRAVESAVSSRRCIAKGCPHVRHPWLRRERFGMMRPSWGLQHARGGALAPNACTFGPYLCDAALILT